jgi:hypothetical protein
MKVRRAACVIAVLVTASAHEASKSGHQQQLTIRDNAMKICKDARP